MRSSTVDCLARRLVGLLRELTSVGLLPEGLRQPADLTLNSNDASVGASIETDPQATVTLSAGTAVDIRGRVVAPGGTINVSGGDIRVRSTAVLDVSGIFLANPLVTTYSTGTVLGGGAIALTSLAGNMVTEVGALFDLRGASVSAASRLIQFMPHDGGHDAWSNGGSLQLLGKNIYFASTIDAAGGAPLATGGNLTIGTTAISDPTKPSPNIIVIEPAGIVAANLPAQGGTAPAGAFIGADTLSNSGLDSVTLNASTTAFGGSVDVTLPGGLSLAAIPFCCRTATGCCRPASVIQISTWPRAAARQAVSPASAVRRST
jgi:hypothetical protein